MFQESGHTLTAYGRETRVTDGGVGPGSYEGAEVFPMQFL